MPLSIDEDPRLLLELKAMNANLASIATSLALIPGQLALILAQLTLIAKSPIVGIEVEKSANLVGSPNVCSPNIKKEGIMAKHFTATLTNKAQNIPTSKAAKGAAAAPLTGFNIQDNGSGSFTVLGVDAAGNQADISGVAALTATSDAPAVVVAGTPAGFTFSLTAATPAPTVGATANITLTATWTDGSVGPFTITLVATISTGPITGLVVTLATPVVTP